MPTGAQRDKLRSLGYEEGLILWAAARHHPLRPALNISGKRSRKASKDRPLPCEAGLASDPGQPAVARPYPTLLPRTEDVSAPAFPARRRRHLCLRGARKPRRSGVSGEQGPCETTIAMSLLE